MKAPRRILEKPGIAEYLQKRNLLTQYKKAKRFFLKGRSGGLDIKERKPKGSGVWSFRINKQRRAIGYFDTDGTFFVSMIDNHQK